MATIPNNKWKELYQNSQFCDVLLVVGKEATSIKVHKLILAVSSPRFASLLFPSKDVKPKELKRSPEGLDIVELVEEDGEIIQIIVSFIYTNDAHVADKNVLALHAASTRYELTRLKEQCETHLQNKLNRDTAVEFYQSLPEGEALDCVMKLIQDKAKYVLESPKFLTLPEEKVISIVKNDKLSIAELDLFRLVVAWAGEQCKIKGLESTPANQRAVLSNVLPHVRFPVLGMKDFVIHVAESGVLSEEEVIGLFTYFASKASKASAATASQKDSASPEEEESDKYSLPFPTEPRKGSNTPEEEPVDDGTLGLANIFDSDAAAAKVEAQPVAEEEEDPGFDLFG